MLESAWDFWKKMEKEVDASSGTKGNVYLYLSFTFGIHIFLNLDFSLDKGSQRPDSRRKMLREKLTSKPIKMVKKKARSKQRS